jgi:hypothetical protein
LTLVERLRSSAPSAATGQMLPHQRGNAGFGAVGNHLESIEEVISFGAQASELGFFRQGLDRNVMLGFIAPLFEVVDLRIQDLNLFLQVSLALVKPSDSARATDKVRAPN